jgi:hypothetical protein
MMPDAMSRNGPVVFRKLVKQAVLTSLEKWTTFKDEDGGNRG